VDPDAPLGRDASRFLPRLGSMIAQPEPIACLLVLTVSLTLFAYRAGATSLWYDETASLARANLSWPLFWQRHETNMLLYEVLLHFWLAATGMVGIHQSALVARLPSILAMALTSIVIVLIGSRYWSTVTGLVAGLIFASDGIILGLSQQARGYAFELLFSCLAWCTVLLILRRPEQTRWWVLYAVATVLAIYTDVISVFDVAAQVAAVGLLFIPQVARRTEDLEVPQGRVLRTFLIPGAATLSGIFVACAYLAYDGISRSSNLSWVPVATPSSLWKFFYDQAEHHTVAAAALLAAVALGLVLGLRSRRGLSIVLLPWAIIPVFGPYLLTQPHLDFHFFYPRYLSAGVPALALLAAIGVTGIRLKALALVASGALLALLALTLSTYYSLYAEHQPLAEVTAWMEHRYAVGDGFICRPDNSVCGVPIGYYLEHLYPGPHYMPTYFPGLYDWALSMSRSSSDATLKSYLPRQKDVFVFTVGPIGGDPDTVVDNVPGFLTHFGEKLEATYRPAGTGDKGDVEVQEYARAKVAASRRSRPSTRAAISTLSK